MGGIELLGPQRSALRLVNNRAAGAGSNETSLFDGIDTSVPGLAALAGLPAGALQAELAAMDTAAKEAARTYDARTPATIVPALARGLTATRAARTAAKGLTAATPDARAEADFLLAFKERDFVEALASAAGITLDPLANAETVTPGDELSVDVRAFLDTTDGITLGKPLVTGPKGWTIAEMPRPDDNDADNPFARFFRETATASTSFRAQAPADAPLTQPYWLAQPRKGDLFDWPAGSPKGAPFAGPLLTASLPVQVAGVSFELTRPVEYRFADRVRGEIRRNVEVVPALTVGLDSRLLVVPSGAAPQQRTMVVRVASQSRQPVSGTLSLTAPAGWTASPAEAPFTLKPGERTAASFTLNAPSPVPVGTVDVGVRATVGAARYTQDLQTIAYPHIQTHRLYAPALARVRAFDVKVAPVTVGYIMGSGDQVPDAIRRMGVPVTLIDSEMLSTGDLSRFDTIVVGVRASEARPDFVANTLRLRQYMERGGTMVVQYQQGDYAQRGLAPFPGVIGARVTDETAAVRILQPSHPRFQFPNAIVPGDFADWVQERNLYAFSTFDPQVHAAARVRRSERGREPRRRALRGHRQGTLRLHFVRVVPPASGGCAWRVSVVREPVEPVEGPAVKRAGPVASVGYRARSNRSPFRVTATVAPVSASTASHNGEAPIAAETRNASFVKSASATF